jgi:hypothetical protein
MTKIHCRKGKRGHKDTEVNLMEGLSGREKQNLIACLKHHYRKVIIINEN